MKNFQHSSNSKANGPIWSELKRIRAFIPVFVSRKFDEDQI